MVRDVVIGASMKSTLTSIQRTREAADKTQLRLATGLRVNSALDQPQNFFQASYLKNAASDLTRMLDSMSAGVRTIQTAINAIETMENILRLAEIKATDARDALEKTGSNLPDLILANDPVAYFQLYDADGLTAANLGQLGAADYINGVSQGDEILFYGAGGLSARFNGVDQYVDVPVDAAINSTGPYFERTVELIFNADDVGGRQVLWEEGGRVNNMNIYIDDGLLRVNGRTTNGVGYGPLDISVPIKAGVTYHVAFTQDANNGVFTGYLNGEEFGSAPIGTFITNHPQENGIGGVSNNVYFHDDVGTAPVRPDGSFAFNGQISDVAIYNSILSQNDLELRYEATSLPLSESYRIQTLKFLEQIEDLTEDANFRGVNLLQKEELVVDFNRDSKSKLKFTGEPFTLESLGVSDINFQKPSQVEASIKSIQKAIAKIRKFGDKLVNVLNIIQIRQDFTRNTIATFQSGASDLTIADQNKEGADLLASQTRIALGTTALSLASQSQSSVIRLFGVPR